MIDHVTYVVPSGAVTGEIVRGCPIAEWMSLLGFTEVEPDPIIEAGWTVSWWKDSDGSTLVHLVERGTAEVALGLAHFCVYVDPEAYESLRNGRWLEAVGSRGDRLWSRGPYGLRAEVRERVDPLPASVEAGEAPVSSSTAPYAPMLESERAQWDVLLEAARVYSERNIRYKDNWRRYGWRGCLYDLRRKVERAWDGLWNAPVDQMTSDPTGYTDDLLDIINYAAITVRAVREGNRDGEGEWWGTGTTPTQPPVPVDPEDN